MRPASTARSLRRSGALRFGATLTLLALVAVPALPTQAGLTSPYVRKSITTLSPGITWEVGVARTGSGKQTVYVARIDPTNPNVSIEALLSNDRVIKLEKPSKNAQRNSRPGKLAMVATNGDVSTAGDAGAGAVMPSMHVHDGVMQVGTSCGRPTLGVDSDGTARIGWVRNRITFDMTQRLPKWWEGQIILRGVNRAPNSNQVSLYTPTFGPSTLNMTTSFDVVINPDGPIPASGVVWGTVEELRPGAVNSTIPAGRFVLVGRGEKAASMKSLVIGDRVSFVTEFGDGTQNACAGKDVVSSWDDTEEALGGNYFTARNGQNVAPTYSQYPKGGVAAPRTNVGITADGIVMLVVVDGRQSGYSIGMNLIEMGDLMLSLGAVHAFNLDGGGSSVMATRPAGATSIMVANRPSDGRERMLTQALAAFAIGD
jgi:hypothetical protein